MSKTIIIGAGPAGISAALYLKRSNKDVTVIYKNTTSLKNAHRIDNYYGLYGVEGSELYEKGLAQARELGIELIEDEVVDIEIIDGFQVLTPNNTYHGDYLVLATGVNRNIPAIRNVSEFEGKGVSYCATCDGFFFRKKVIGILGNDSYALHEANYLSNLAKEVVIFTDGKPVNNKELEKFRIVPDKLTHLEGDEFLEAAVSESGRYPIDALFIALGSAGALDFARKLGLDIADNLIVVDKNNQTNLPRLYAAGDITKGFKQIAKAVYEGAVVANSIIENDRD